MDVRAAVVPLVRVLRLVTRTGELGLSLKDEAARDVLEHSEPHSLGVLDAAAASRPARQESDLARVVRPPSEVADVDGLAPDCRRVVDEFLPRELVAGELQCVFLSGFEGEGEAEVDEVFQDRGEIPGAGAGEVPRAGLSVHGGRLHAGGPDAVAGGCFGPLHIQGGARDAVVGEENFLVLAREAPEGAAFSRDEAMYGGPVNRIAGLCDIRFLPAAIHSSRPDVDRQDVRRDGAHAYDLGRVLGDGEARKGKNEGEDRGSRHVPPGGPGRLPVRSQCHTPLAWWRFRRLRSKIPAGQPASAL